jgi:hypothetical protein
MEYRIRVHCGEQAMAFGEYPFDDELGKRLEAGNGHEPKLDTVYTVDGILISSG